MTSCSVRDAANAVHSSEATDPPINAYGSTESRCAGSWRHTTGCRSMGSVNDEAAFSEYGEVVDSRRWTAVVFRLKAPYDAAYLALATEMRLPLATTDHDAALLGYG